MKVTLARESILNPLQLVSGVVERRQTLPILSNVLLKLQATSLTLTATDLEVELVGRTGFEQTTEAIEVTLPARKLLDICRSLPNDANIEFSFEETQVVLRSGKSRFLLSTLPATEFPAVESEPGDIEFVIQQQDLHDLIEKTAFSMAQQDVRYYLNGLLLDISDNKLSCVATDGHRLALCQLENQSVANYPNTQVIIPRKGVLELLRLLTTSEQQVSVNINKNHIRVQSEQFIFSSKLIDGRFPDFKRVVPTHCDKTLLLKRELIKNVLSRVAILSNEKYRGIRFTLTEGKLSISATNPEQEHAEEELDIDYSAEGLEIGFNVNYILDVLSNLKSEQVSLSLSDPNSSLLIEDPSSSHQLYVVMPMRL